VPSVIANLNGLVIQIEEREAGSPARPKGSGIDVQLRRERPYRSRLVAVFGEGRFVTAETQSSVPARTKRRPALSNAKTRDAARRIVIVGGRTRRNS